MDELRDIVQETRTGKTSPHGCLGHLVAVFAVGYGTFQMFFGSGGLGSRVTALASIVSVVIALGALVSLPVMLFRGNGSGFVRQLGRLVVALALGFICYGLGSSRNLALQILGATIVVPWAVITIWLGVRTFVLILREYAE